MKMKRFEFNLLKALQIIKYLEINLGGSYLNLIRLLNLVFFADHYHINKYGKLINGGSYYHSKDGPIQSELFHILFTENPFIVHIDDCVTTYIDYDESIFSISNIEALNYVIKSYGSCSNGELIDFCDKKISKKYKNRVKQLDVNEFITDDSVINYINTWNSEYQKK